MKYELNESGQIVESGNAYDMPNGAEVFAQIRALADALAKATGGSADSIFEIQLGSLLKSAKKIVRDAQGEKVAQVAQYIKDNRTVLCAGLDDVAEEFRDVVKGAIERYGVDSMVPRAKDEDERFTLISKTPPALDAIAEELGEFTMTFSPEKGYRVTVSDPTSYAYCAPIFEAQAEVVGAIKEYAETLGIKELHIAWDGTTPVLKSNATPASSGGIGAPRVTESHKDKVIETKLKGVVLKGTWVEIMPKIVELVPDAKAQMVAHGLSFSPAHYVTKYGFKKIGAEYARES